MSNDKRKKIILIIISILIILLIILLGVFVSTKKDNNNSENNNSNTSSQNTISDSEKDEKKIRKLKNISESERIRTYLGTYFKYIENKDFEYAYNLLYPEFKNNYFPELKDFEKYITEQNYPQMLNIDYQDIYMQGKYYIVELSVKDFLGKNIRYNKECKFIIQENDYNDFYLSFQK